MPERIKVKLHGNSTDTIFYRIDAVIQDYRGYPAIVSNGVIFSAPTYLYKDLIGIAGRLNAPELVICK